MAAAAMPASRFAHRVEMRTTCRLAFIKADREHRLRPAELRQIRVTRGSVGVLRQSGLGEQMLGAPTDLAKEDKF